MLCSMLHSVTESNTSVCTQVPTFHLLLQQPAASAPRPATRPASATKQQQPPAALATAPPLRRLHRQLRLRRLSDRPASGSRRLPRQRRLPVPGGPAAAFLRRLQVPAATAAARPPSRRRSSVDDRTCVAHAATGRQPASPGGSCTSELCQYRISFVTLA